MITKETARRSHDSSVQRSQARRTRRRALGIDCDRWLGDGDTIDGIAVVSLKGSKTPGELALVVDDTLITGDLVRGQHGGKLNILPDAKLSDRAAAKASVERLAELPVTAVLVGDGWSVFNGGQASLKQLALSL